MEAVNDQRQKRSEDDRRKRQLVAMDKEDVRKTEHVTGSCFVDMEYNFFTHKRKHKRPC